MKAPDEKGKGLLPRGDRLAIERTLLANERTFLAYFRTSVVFLTSGVAVLHLEFFAEIRQISFFLIVASPVVLLAGVWRLFVVRRRVHAYYSEANRAATPSDAGPD